MDAALFGALEHVDDRARTLVRLVYFEGMTVTDAAAPAGYPSREAAEQAHYHALRKIRSSSAAKRLRPLLDDFGDFDIASEATRGTGLRRFRETWESATERTVIRLLEGGVRGGV